MYMHPEKLTTSLYPNYQSDNDNHMNSTNNSYVSDGDDGGITSGDDFDGDYEKNNGGGDSDDDLVISMPFNVKAELMTTEKDYYEYSQQHTHVKISKPFKVSATSHTYHHDVEASLATSPSNNHNVLPEANEEHPM